ncbi:branched-chain amino acid aminotransferase [Hydrogenobacter thermophilus TK-6]|uniref:Branched-chain-amino-acid aminotransferase n=1 Tax=Hydrogenobacter thermophilus (strain DSM 6534 / IAM 12695 / TK-6) TaxID=608538 RepID=D3DFU9_HYDTT|nr:branched-chain-amino-acid transaminase [Hydrogenobacter thermophilus]ADO44640.1 branched-chain amino acid aminotransferase [Hydrogenobacter thermophilus TK-6]BAI68701.1 branched-chain amino acid aminotransferase [Hydrogenobacter thermophilus TK-6]
MEYAFFEGRIVPVEEANINIKTNSFHYGTAVFEGIRAYWNEKEQQLYILFAREHYLRLLKNAKAMFMEIPYTVDELVEITKEILRKSEIKWDVYIRPIAYFKDLALTPKLLGFTPEVAIYTYNFGRYLDTSEGIKVKVSSWRRNDDNSIPSRWKVAGAYVNSALAKTEALLAGYDEAIMLNQHGFVAEGSGENIFLIRGRKAITPSYSEHILEGITRSAIIKLLQKELVVEVEERPVARSELYTADELFMTGTAAEVTPIVEVDNRKVGDGKVGPMTKELQELYFNAVRGNIERYKVWLTPVYEK